MPIGAGDTSAPRLDVIVGVLALQGAFDVHCQRLEQLGVVARLVRTPADLAGLDAIVLPGGESTTMSRLLTTSGLFDQLKGLLIDGLPVFGTCAGMILCATEVLDARPDQRGFDLIDLTVRRNGYGRQLDSFEADLAVDGLTDAFHAVFIRAPFVERVGPDVHVLACHDGVPVLVRSGRCTVAAFHPELTDDARLHQLFLDTLTD
ncbi:MAG TPA: pyridoxal 5'-phosphate synthase glutaminase subunit PdxT [Ilumatobacteraceae bacterium]|nr:pyridoxal 5'-phosphate synthase glutaminase subunit PdxT [Ilumatobacteraceae bacterium]